MARLARVVVPGIPHHVTQRGNGRQQTFFCDDDYALYRELLGETCRAAGVEIWAWCLMPNHVHLILTPSDSDGLRHALARLHRTYAGLIHEREGRTGHFWQGRYGAVVMDEEHLAAAIPYVLQNPVRAELVRYIRQWRWSSYHAHRSAKGDGITTREPVDHRFPDLTARLGRMRPPEELITAIRRAESIGRPLGSLQFLEWIEEQTGRTVIPQKRGPKPKNKPVG